MSGADNHDEDDDLPIDDDLGIDGDLPIDDDLGIDADLPIDDDLPIACEWFGEPIPDIGALPRERWREVFETLSDRGILRAKMTVRHVSDVPIATHLAMRVINDRESVRAAARAAAPAELPAAASPRPTAGRQVNFRLGPREHAELVEVARMYGTRPTAVARMLTVRGVELALRTANREQERRRRSVPGERRGL